MEHSDKTDQISGSKSAGNAYKEKQSAMDKAVNRAKESDETDLSNAEEKQLRGRRDHSEKRSGHNT